MAQRYDPFGIVIDGGELKSADASEYEQSVRWHLDLIQRSQTGLALLRGIQRTGKHLTIRPWTSSAINATTRALDQRAATPQGAFVLGGSGRPQMRGRWIKDPMLGTGTGSDVEIRYLPKMFGFGGTAPATFAPTLPGIGATAALFHEMAHGYRMNIGHLYRARTMGGRLLYDDEEEFFAIVLTNIFVTDPTTEVMIRTLRADHHGFTPLATAQATSSGFLQVSANKQMLVRLFTQEPGLVGDLIKVNSTFNPVQQYFQLPAFPTLGP